MKFIIVLLSLMITSQALATGGKNEPSGNSSSVSGAVAGSVSGSAAHSVSASESASQAKAASSVGDTTATGGDSAVTVKTPRQRSKVKINNVPSLSAPGMHSSNPCALGGSGGVVVAGYGITGGKQKIDPGCVRRELTRIAFAAGLNNRGTYMLCKESVLMGMYDSLEDCLSFGESVELESHEEHILLKQCDEEKGELLDRVTKECGTRRK